MNTPLFDETVMAVGLHLPTFDPTPSHEDFLLKHEFQTWLDDLYARSRQVTASTKRRPRKKS